MQVRVCVYVYGLLLQSVNILKGKEKIKLLQAKIFGLNHNVNSSIKA